MDTLLSKSLFPVSKFLSALIRAIEFGKHAKIVTIKIALLKKYKEILG